MEIKEWIKKVQENIIKSDLKQLYADEALVMGTVKARKTREGKVMKEGQIRIAFIDMTTLKPISKIVISVSTAIGLINALQAQVKRIEADIKSEKIPEKVKKEPILTYIG